MSDKPWWDCTMQEKTDAGAHVLKCLLDAGFKPRAYVDMGEYYVAIIPKGDRDFYTLSYKHLHKIPKFWIDDEPVNYHGNYIFVVPNTTDTSTAELGLRPPPSWLSNGCQNDDNPC